VIQYEHSCTDWIQKIENCVRYLKEKNNVDQPKSYDFDLAIICALDEPELSEVLKLDWNWSLPKPIDDNTFIYEGSVLLNGRPIKISATHASRMGMVATAIKTASIINILRPRLVVMTGICGGVKKHTNYGDVIFAECAWDYQSGKLKREDGQSVFEVSPHQLMATTQVRSKMELLKADKKFISEISQDFDGHLITNPKLLLGPIATGAAVVADPVYVNTIVGNNKKVLGIEMEIYGLYSAVENSSNPRPKVFALKSVCDFADAKKDDDYQKYCSYMSANVLRVFIERYGDYFF
jgi:nucleoside phosphorylase